MANVSKLFFGAALAAVSIASPALAAHKHQIVHAHHVVHVTPSSQGRGLYNFVPVSSPSCPGLPACDPVSHISYPEGEPGGD